MTRGWMSPVKRFPIAVFVVLSVFFTFFSRYLVSLSVVRLLSFPLARTYFLLLLSTINHLPFLIAAVIVVLIIGGKSELVTVCKRLGRWKFPAAWYAIALGFPALLAVPVYLFSDFRFSFSSDLFIFAGMSGVNSVLSALSNAMGWYGFVLPVLLQRYKVFGAVLAITALKILFVIVLWLPPFLKAISRHGNIHFPVVSVVAIFPLAVLCTWLYVNTGGSVLPVFLYSFARYALFMGTHGIDIKSYGLYIGAEYCIVIILLSLYGPGLITKSLAARTMTQDSG